MELPQRRHPRLKGYDYSQSGCYFVTICTKERAPLLGKVAVGRGAHTPPITVLSHAGQVTEHYICRIDSAYSGVKVERYVIMPDHIHLLLRFFEPEDGGLRASRPTLHTVVRSLKGLVSRQLGASVWQSSYYEHVVRNEEDFLEICRYIEHNPIKAAQRE